MIRRTLLAVLALITLAPTARAATTFEFLFTGGYPLSISDDGNTIAGNEVGTYGPFRWTRSGGFQSLGMAAAPIVGGSAGTTNVSADGTRVSSTIVGPDSTYFTQGLWTLGSGWQYMMPPIPPGAGVVDQGLSSNWGISRDGNTVVGLLERPGGVGGSAHASKWTQATGAVDLGSSGRASRANGVNADGSIIVGWDESTAFGYRGPAVWENGVLLDLAPHQIGEVQCSNASGNVIGGFLNDSTVSIRKPTLWRKNGNSWTTHKYEPIAGTENNGGFNRINAVTDDGNLAVGYCSFGGDPFYTTGFIWADTSGAIDIVQYLGEHGILPDPSFTIYSLECMTPDGTKLVGWGRDTTTPFTIRAFMIHIDRPVVGVEPGVDIALRVTAAPNPVRTQTTLSFSLARADEGSLTVHDSAGRIVRHLFSGAMSAGPQHVSWDGRDDAGTPVAPGIYFSRLVGRATSMNGKLVVVR